jgi:hypothetical protein
MADITEAFNTLKFQKKTFQNIDYFFTQRNLTEDHEYLDKNMNRKTKKVKVVHNFLAISIPTINMNSPGFDIEIFGDEGYHYKGTITSFQGNVPNFMIPIKGDKKLFVHINYKIIETNSNNSSESQSGIKKFVNFIEVPKRFQILDENANENESQISKKNDDIEM